MGTYNLLQVDIQCLHCTTLSEVQAEFRFGFMNFDRYKIGDRLEWSDRGGGLRSPKTRPEHGNFKGEAYVECPVCNRDFWLDVTVINDVIDHVEVNLAKKGYITSKT